MHEKKVVVIGGGTGTYTAICGLKKYTDNITAIVSMMDDGGSSGVLRDEHGVLPPGDVRRSIIALSDSTELMKRLFQYRFHDGIGLAGHNMGNLIITALRDIMGDDAEAIKEAGNILNIRGKVLPVTTQDSRLCAELEDGRVITGETNIDIPKHDPNTKIKEVFLRPEAQLFNDCRHAIAEADIIVIGPGDLYTSILPNLLVRGLRSAIKNSKATKVYVCNLMTKYGETNNFTAVDFVAEIERYLGSGILDGVIINSKVPSNRLLQRYEVERSYLVIDNSHNITDKKVIREELVSEPVLVRHDPDRLAKAILTNF